MCSTKSTALIKCWIPDFKVNTKDNQAKNINIILSSNSEMRTNILSSNILSSNCEMGTNITKSAEKREYPIIRQDLIFDSHENLIYQDNKSK